jgi:hypothetical protein
MDRILQPSVARVPSYADNMLTMARNESDAVSITEALWSALEAHPVGRLQPKKRSWSGPGEPVCFLGHSLELVGKTVKITPTPENEAKFHRKVKAGLASLNDHFLSDYVRWSKAADLRAYISSWTANFSRCGGMQERKGLLFAKIATALGEHE